MVKLKSFRYIEPESTIELSSSRTNNENEQTGRESRQSLKSFQEDQVEQIELPDDDSDLSEPSSQQGQAKQVRAKTPSLARLRQQFLVELANNQVPPSSLSPIITRALNEKAAISQLDSASALNMNALGTHQFEIRWRSVHLFAKKRQSMGATISSSLRSLLFASSSSETNNNEIKGTLQNANAKTNNHHQSIAINNTPKMALRRSMTNACNEPQINMTLNEQKMYNNNNSVLQMAINDHPLDEFLNNPTQYKPILNNVSGSVFSGQLTAILGPSGVGKSTLLNTLTGRNQLSGIGSVQLHGCSKKRLSVVFVPQWDVLPEFLTTLEDLQFTSRLKWPKYTSKQHDANIDRIVKLLQLDKFLHIRIKKLSGGQARRLSIARELLGAPDIMILDEPTSGLDANTCKKIIEALRELTEQSESLLDRPMSIIATIHQPQQEVYNLFHRVYVMAQGGRAIYEGPPYQLLDTFLENSTLGKCVTPDQLNDNPAIVALEVASGEYGQTIIDDLARFHQLFQQDEQTPFGTPRSVFMRTPKAALRSPKISSPKFKINTPTTTTTTTTTNNQSIQGSIQGSPVISIAMRTVTKSDQRHNWNQWDKVSAVTSDSYASTYDNDLPDPIAPKLKVDKRLRRSVVMQSDFPRQTWTLIKRSWLTTNRDFFLMMIRIFGFIGVAGGGIQIFSESLDPNDNQCPFFESKIEDLRSYMDQSRYRISTLTEFIGQSYSTRMYFFHLICTTMVIVAALSGLIFPIQLRMFLREYKNGWYSAASFITSITLSELLVDLIGPTIMVGATYQLCHQPDSQYHWREIAYLSIISLMALCVKSQSQIVSSFLRNSIENSVFMSCVVVVFPIFTSGLPVAIYNLPQWIRSVSIGSYARWTYEGLNLVRYGYDMCPCDSTKVNGFPVQISPDAVPERLHTLSRNLLDYYSNRAISSDLNETSNAIAIANVTASTGPSIQKDSLFAQFVRLASSAANPLVDTQIELGTCETYRSLALIELAIPDNILARILLTLGATFIISRILTYFCVKAVIKLSNAN